MVDELQPLGTGNKIALDKHRILIGSHRLCDVVIRSQDIAPVHCELVRRGSWWYVRALAAGFQTKLNALPVTDEKIHPGDILWIGDRHYEIAYDPHEPNSDSARDEVSRPP